MRELDYFKQFIRQPDVKKTVVNRDVISYTRVSSSGQKDNYSLPQQQEAAWNFARKHDYNIIKELGNTYESASGDMTRKEFVKLIEEIKASKIKPFGILVWVVSRFSRTGGKAISLLNELVEILGVHLIEVSSGYDTTTDDGKLYIYEKLLIAKKENIDRLKNTVQGMRKFVKAGNYLGICPLGYDHYGPRVRNSQFVAMKQKIEINADGEKLKVAWEMKAKGTADYLIIKFLDSVGLKISKQKISTIWRNPFYSGIQTNAFTEGQPVPGNWPPLVSVETFIKVQQILLQNHHGYQVDHIADSRPLLGTLFCLTCGKKMAGYLVKRKGLHYYKCQTCKNATINALTSNKFPSKTGVHDLFRLELERYILADIYIEPFKLQMKKMADLAISSTQQIDSVYKKRKTELENKRQALEERFAFGQIPEEMYIKFKKKLDTEERELIKEQVPSGLEISNFDLKLDKALDLSQNISKYWVSGNHETRKHIQKLVFPEGLVIDTKNRRLLTSKVNRLFAEKAVFARDTEGGKQKLPTKNGEESGLVAGEGFEPPTFGL